MIHPYIHKPLTKSTNSILKSPKRFQNGRQVHGVIGMLGRLVLVIIAEKESKQTLLGELGLPDSLFELYSYSFDAATSATAS
jgi:hypothetical protein